MSTAPEVRVPGSGVLLMVAEVLPVWAAKGSEKRQRTVRMPNRRTSPIVVRYGQEVSIRDQANDSERPEQLPERFEDTPQLTEPTWLIAVRAAQAKKALDIAVLDLREVTTLADHFVICTGTNIRQNQAICDEIHLQAKASGELPHCIEGYEHAEWILMDYGDVIIHIFLDRARTFYDLERLWRHAKKVEVPEPAAA
jgi:ribosome-associated protein